MYDFNWHKKHAEGTAYSGQVILNLLRDIAPIKSMLDVGCGDGLWMRAAAEAGMGDAMGIDGPWTEQDQLVVDPAKIVTCNLEEPVTLGRHFDLVICLEVAEHLPASAARTLLSTLIHHGDMVLFGAAVPRQGGFRHINERWQSEWVAEMSGFGYQVFDVVRASIWDDPRVQFWYKQNALLYVNRSNTTLMSAVSAFMERADTRPMPIDVIHPYLFSSISRYEQIAFKPLLRKLPNKTVEKMLTILSGRN